MNRKRLRAEDFRDSLLQVSGMIDLGYGGPNIKEGTTSEYGWTLAPNLWRHDRILRIDSIGG